MDEGQVDASSHLNLWNGALREAVYGQIRKGGDTVAPYIIIASYTQKSVQNISLPWIFLRMPPFLLVWTFS